MAGIKLINSAFSLRAGEATQLWRTEPNEGRYIAVQLFNITMPPGDFQAAREQDGATVEQVGVASCQRNNDGLWIWCHLDPATKEAIGDYLIDTPNVERGRWYYLVIEDQRMLPQPLTV